MVSSKRESKVAGFLNFPPSNLVSFSSEKLSAASAKVNSLPGMAPLVLDSYDDDKLVVIESDDEPLTTVAKAIHAPAGKPDHREYPSVLPINTLQLYVNAEAAPDVKSFALMTLESSLVSHLKFLIPERSELLVGKFQLRHGLVLMTDDSMLAENGLRNDFNTAVWPTP